MDTEGAISFRALSPAEYKKLKSDLQKEYLAKGKKWVAARKKAEADGAEFADPRPVKPRSKALDKMSTRANAQKLAAKYRKKHEEEQKAKKKAEAL